MVGESSGRDQRKGETTEVTQATALSNRLTQSENRDGVGGNLTVSGDKGD